MSSDRIRRSGNLLRRYHVLGGMHPSEADKLERFVAERGRPLLAAAKLLTGSQEAAEDLLQAALERLIRHWSRIDGSAPPPCAEAGLIQGMGLPGPDDWAAEFRAALSCGVYKVADTEQVNGMHLIKLTAVHPAPVTTVFWIDPLTYQYPGRGASGKAGWRRRTN